MTGGGCLKTLFVGALVTAGLLLVVFAAVSVIGMLRAGDPSSVGAGAPPARVAPEVAEKPEPCHVSGSPQARNSFAGWCQGGIFTLVNVSADADNLTVMTQFSRKGMAAWRAGRSKVLSLYRPLVDQAAASGMNVAIAFADPNGEVIGGCVRRQIDPATTCK